MTDRARDEDQTGDQTDDQAGQTSDRDTSGRLISERLKETAELLQHPALWKAGALQQQAKGTSTGFKVLDRHLPGNGWPVAGLCELMLPTAGIGELKLLLPALKALSRQARWIAWVNPPFIPYAPALKAAGVDIDKILLIHPKNHKDALWSLERATRSGTCSAALAWLDEAQLKTKDTQRLQLAARQGGTLGCLFRPEKALTENSMAELRIWVRRGNGEALNVNLCKRRGGWPVSGLSLSLEEGRRPAEIREQLSLWRQCRSTGTPPASADRSDRLPLLRPNPSDVEQHITH
jgi:cell division inhibitor SulA/protein ImuA